MLLIELLSSFVILTVLGITVFDILSDCQDGKIKKTEAGFFTLVFSVFAVVALLIIFGFRR